MEEVDRRKFWENVLLMCKPVTKHMRVCSKHFKFEDYITKSGILSNKVAARLCKKAVPSQHLPSKPFDVKTIKCARNDRLVRRQQLRQQSVPKPTSPVLGEVSPVEMHNISVQEFHITGMEQDAIDGLLQLFERGDQPSTSSQCDKTFQVSSGDFKTEFWQTINSDSMLNSISGVPNFVLLKVICGLVDQYYPRKRHTILCTMDSILLVFMKLKLGIKFKVISFFFHVSSSLCLKVFHELIQISNIFKSFIVWPSIDECRQNIPKSLKNFQNVRVILDCTEIGINQQKCLCCRVKTYSFYKKKNSLKIMTGVSPGGLLTFVSKVYGGRTSDKTIFEESGIINMLEPQVDAIMVDKGFLVEDLCNSHFIKIIQPNFLRKKSNLMSRNHYKTEKLLEQEFMLKGSIKNYAFSIS